MGQTLTHGVYLPDEGERNCYSGLAANWQLLDNSVGTIAEHTTALAGKAPAVHTHAKADITDFPAYGTTAGTICEGNDSRLSDARTPVAHTHTKSDVTDLLNSNFIPSANNSYDLGSSSYQWNNVYSKNYFYNGTEFQSKFATLDTDQTITGVKTLTDNWRLQAPKLTAGAGEIYGRMGYSLIYTDKNDVEIGSMFIYKNANAARTFIAIRGGDYYTNGVPDATGTPVRSALIVGTDVSGKKIIECNSDVVYPTTDNTTDLGTSTNKWKSLNGINPGALSLPDIYDSYDVVTTNWSTAYNQPNDLKINGANPSYPGWLFIRLDNCTAADDFVIVRYYHVNANNLTFFGSFIPKASSYVLSVPIQAGITTKVWVSKIPTTCKYYACLGTVK
jgi:hypothetical protein